MIGLELCLQNKVWLIDPMKQEVLFICTHNSARSQMAEAFLNKLFSHRFESYSAGIQPTKINPYVISAMNELDIDLSRKNSKSVKEFLNREIDLVVTVCDGAKESCPFFPGAKKYIHKAFEDPSKFQGTDEEILQKIRQVRDENKELIESNFK